MKVGVLATMIFGFLIGFPMASMAGLAPDADGDGVPDVLDNCDQLANASPLDCDSNLDGYGNRCDGDLNNDLAVAANDFNLWRKSFQQGTTDGDHDCSGATGANDFNLWRKSFQNPGNFSSGLSCAGSIPCM